MLEPGNNEALKIETCRRIQDLRECRPALSELVGIETDEQNGKGNDWSGQDLSQEAEYVCLRRYPPAPNGTEIAPNWGKVQISTSTYGHGLGHPWP